MIFLAQETSSPDFIQLRNEVTDLDSQVVVNPHLIFLFS